MIMNIHFFDGSVFECAETEEIDMIVNTVNCKGVMGAGLALEYKLRYPDMYADYERQCNLGNIKIGYLDIFDNNGIKIMNFPTKDHWRMPSEIKWIEKGLLYLYENFKEMNVESIAFPKLGTNHGGLEWEKVRNLMVKCFERIPSIQFYICLDKSEPKGVEGKMLNLLENISENEAMNIGISSRVYNNIKDSFPLRRFFYLTRVPGVGKVTYKKLHQYYFPRAIKEENGSDKDEDNKGEQLTLF